MKTVCELNKCVGCHACKDLCPKDAIQIVDSGDCLMQRSMKKSVSTATSATMSVR